MKCNRKLLGTVYLIWQCAFVFPSANAAPTGDVFSNFRGQWEYTGKFELGGRVYPILLRYKIWQSGRRVCGTVDRGGAGANARPESYSFAGFAYNGHADIRKDAGSPADFNYEPRYPFITDEFIRLHKRDGHLTYATFESERNSQLPAEFPENGQFSETPRMPLRFLGSLEALAKDELPATEAELAFLGKCLTDPAAENNRR